MKRPMTKLLLLVGLVPAFAVGCATVQSGQQSLVCPQCKTVFFSDEGSTTTYSFDKSGDVHRCPGCQGRMRALFTEGKLEHRCTTCQQQAFTCEGHDW
jgi:hypothetical protein